MGNRFAEIAFTDTVKGFQEAYGSRRSYARMEIGENSKNVLGEAETAFIGARDSFYMATVSETGWPYVQHRGGPAGFVKVLDPTTLGFADFRGNRQYVSIGNLETDNRVSLFFMDYPNRRRLKLLGRTRVIGEADQDRLGQLVVPDYRAAVERGHRHRCRGVRLELPAAHHAQIHRRRRGRGKLGAAGPHRRS